MSLRSGDRPSSDAPERRRTRNALVVVQVALGVRPVGWSRPDDSDVSRAAKRSARVCRARTRSTGPPDDSRDARQGSCSCFRLQRDSGPRGGLPGVTPFADKCRTDEPFVSSNRLMTETTVDNKEQNRGSNSSPGCFATVGTPVVAGRDFEWIDLEQRRAVAVVSENWLEKPGKSRQRRWAGGSGRVRRVRGARSSASSTMCMTMACRRLRRRSPTGPR